MTGANAPTIYSPIFKEPRSLHTSSIFTTESSSKTVAVSKFFECGIIRFTIRTSVTICFCLFLSTQVSNRLILRQVSKRSATIFCTEGICLVKNSLAEMSVIVVFAYSTIVAVTTVEIVPSCRNGFGLGLSASGAGVGHLPCFRTGSSFDNRTTIPRMVLIYGDIANMLGSTTSSANTVYATRTRASSILRVLFPLVTSRLSPIVLIGLLCVFIAGMKRVALFRTSRSNDSFGKRVLLSRDSLSVSLSASRTGKCTNTIVFVGRLNSDNTVTVAVSKSRNRLCLLVRRVMRASERTDTIFLAGCRFGYNTLAPIMTQCRNDFRLRFTVARAGISADTILVTSCRFGYDTLAPIMTQRRNDLRLRCAITRTGISTNASMLTGGLFGNNALIPIMTKSIHEITILGQILVLVADVNGVALFRTGRSNRLAGMPSLFNHRNGFGLGFSTNRAGKCFYTRLVNRSGLSDFTIIPAMRNHGGIVCLVGKTINLVALINGVALRGASCRNNFLHMISLVEHRNFIIPNLTTGLALERTNASLEIGRLFRHNTLVPIMTSCRRITIVVVFGRVLVANVLHPAVRGARSRMVANNKSELFVFLFSLRGVRYLNRLDVLILRRSCRSRDYRFCGSCGKRYGFVRLLGIYAIFLAVGRFTSVGYCILVGSVLLGIGSIRLCLVSIGVLIRGFGFLFGFLFGFGLAGFSILHSCIGLCATSRCTQGHRCAYCKSKRTLLYVVFLFH